MANMTIEQQLQRDQEYHRVEALRQAREFSTQQGKELAATELLDLADQFYQFIKNGKTTEGEKA